MVQAQQEYYYGTGKRKTAIARVRLYLAERGAPQVMINGRPLEEAFPWVGWQHHILHPFRVTGTEGRFSVVAKVEGGGVNAQSEAIRHGIARALVAYDENLRLPLKKAGLLTRDARVKERKKYGLRRARRAKQYTKR